MEIVVQKYGGTSVEDKEKMETICKNILEYKKRGNKMVIVVSAQGKYTDTLIEKASTYTNSNMDKKDLDMLLSTGEVQSASLLSLILNSKNVKSVALNGMQAGIISDSNFGNAHIKNIYPDNILNYLEEDYVVVVTGFQATDKFGNITTLGRGGSDLSAVAIASSLKAVKCEIYSDIDGIYCADPRIIKKSKLLKNISYDEMLEAASAGAKVLHNRSVIVAKKNNIPIIVKNSQKKSRGSIVRYEEKNKKDIEEYEIKFITKKDDISKICIVGEMIMSNKNLISKIFDIASDENIDIYMISFSELALNIVVGSKDSEHFMEKLHEELIEKNKI